jgi:hypothetical protein
MDATVGAPPRIRTNTDAYRHRRANLSRKKETGRTFRSAKSLKRYGADLAVRPVGLSHVSNSLGKN